MYIQLYYNEIHLLLQVLLRFFSSLRNLSQVFAGPTLNRLWSLLFLLLHLILTLGWRCFHLRNISLKLVRDLVSRHIHICVFVADVFETHNFLCSLIFVNEKFQVSWACQTQPCTIITSHEKGWKSQRLYIAAIVIFTVRVLHKITKRKSVKKCL